jgi:hypothetical protein
MSTGPTIPFIKGGGDVLPANDGLETAAKFHVSNYESRGMVGGKRRRKRKSCKSKGLDEPTIAAAFTIGGKKTRRKRRRTAKSRTKSCWSFF